MSRLRTSKTHVEKSSSVSLSLSLSLSLSTMMRITCRRGHPKEAKWSWCCWGRTQSGSLGSIRSRAEDDAAGRGCGCVVPAVPNTFSSARAWIAKQNPISISLIQSNGFLSGFPRFRWFIIYMFVFCFLIVPSKWLEIFIGQGREKMW